MKISEVVKQYRERMGLSLRDFANRCGISHTTISFIENEKNPTTGRPMELSLITYQKLANGMGMSLQTLWELLGDDMAVPMKYTEEEQLLISAWRAADDMDRELARRALHLSSDPLHHY